MDFSTGQKSAHTVAKPTLPLYCLRYLAYLISPREPITLANLGRARLGTRYLVHELVKTIPYLNNNGNNHPTVIIIIIIIITIIGRACRVGRLSTVPEPTPNLHSLSPWPESPWIGAPPTLPALSKKASLLRLLRLLLPLLLPSSYSLAVPTRRPSPNRAVTLTITIARAGWLAGPGRPITAWRVRGRKRVKSLPGPVKAHASPSFPNDISWPRLLTTPDSSHGLD